MAELTTEQLARRFTRRFPVKADGTSGTFTWDRGDRPPAVRFEPARSTRGGRRYDGVSWCMWAYHAGLGDTVTLKTPVRGQRKTYVLKATPAEGRAWLEWQATRPGFNLLRAGRPGNGWTPWTGTPAGKFRSTGNYEQETRPWTTTARCARRSRAMTRTATSEYPRSTGRPGATAAPTWTAATACASRPTDRTGDTIMRPQVQIRKMRTRRPSPARKTDGIRQTYYDPEVRAAKAVRVRADREQESGS